MEAPVGNLFFNDQASCLVTVLGWIFCLFVCILSSYCLNREASLEISRLLNTLHCSLKAEPWSASTIRIQADWIFFFSGEVRFSVNEFGCSSSKTDLIYNEMSVAGMETAQCIRLSIIATTMARNHTCWGPKSNETLPLPFQRGLGCRKAFAFPDFLCKNVLLICFVAVVILSTVALHQLPWGHSLYLCY